MKTLKHLSFFGFALTLILSSCSMEKRQYMSGYYVSWHNSHHGTDKVVKNKSINLETSESKKIETNVITDQTETSFADNSALSENNITASADNSLFIPTSHKIDLNKKSNKTIAQQSKAAYEIKTFVKGKTHQSSKQKRGDDIPLILLYVLCFFFPPIAVGLATNWDIETIIINIVLCLLCGIPGIIHALIVVSRS